MATGLQNISMEQRATGIKFSYDKEPKHLLSANNIIRTSDALHQVLVNHDPHRYPSLTLITDNIIEEKKYHVTKNIQEELSFLMSSLICTLLEDTLIKLKCLDQCNNGLKIIKTMADMVYLKTMKYDVKPFVILDNIVKMSKQELNSTVKKVAKLEADRKYVNEAIQKTYLEIALQQNLKILKECNKEMVDRNFYNNDLEIEEARNKATRRELNKQVRQQRNHFKSVLYDTHATIELLRAKVEDFILLSDTRCRYVVNWQVARTEQNHKTIADTEVHPLTTISYFKQRSEHEIRVHAEVDMFVNIIINETLTNVEKWMDKYDHDMENIDLKIQIQKNEYQDMRDTRIAMEKKLEIHDKRMQDWIHFKKEREEARLYREKMTNAATAVQAWWRGLIVRLKLGPYKEKKIKGMKQKKIKNN